MNANPAQVHSPPPPFAAAPAVLASAALAAGPPRESSSATAAAHSGRAAMKSNQRARWGMEPLDFTFFQTGQAARVGGC